MFNTAAFNTINLNSLYVTRLLLVVPGVGNVITLLTTDGATQLRTNDSPIVL